MSPRNACIIANRVDPDKTRFLRISLIWVCNVCSDLSVQNIELENNDRPVDISKYVRVLHFSFERKSN